MNFLEALPETLREAAAGFASQLAQWVLARSGEPELARAALALAQVNRRADIAALRDVWVEQGRIEALLRHPTHTTSSSPVMTMQLQRGDYRLDFFSTFTAFAMPADVTLQQLKIECFYPADEATAAIARKLSAG